MMNQLVLGKRDTSESNNRTTKTIFWEAMTLQFSRRSCIGLWNRGIHAYVKDLKTGKVVYKKG